jgi:hypothetical protein
MADVNLNVIESLQCVTHPVILNKMVSLLIQEYSLNDNEDL